MGNSLDLSAETRATFGGQYYKDLPDSVSDAFDDFEIEYDEIEDATDKEIKDFFQRLQEGLPLTGSEKLNSVDSKLRDYCKALSSNLFFADNVLLTDKRYAYFDILSKAAAIEIEGIEVGLRFEDLRAVFESQEMFSQDSMVAKRLEAALSFLSGGLPNSAPITRNRSVTQSIITLACALQKGGVPLDESAEFGRFCNHFASELAKQVELGQKATDADYLAFQRTINANTRQGAKIRHEILLRKLLQFSPSLAGGSLAAEALSGGLANAVKKSGAEIANLVSDINDAYAAKNGSDFFKSTNKTTKALSQIGILIDSFDKYREFIDSLYFLIWEGPGQKLRDSSPPSSFSDVNKLRTNLQHDVDHGKPAGVKKKNKDLGAAFERYAGVPSPEVASPERFPIMQSNLLNALKQDLLDMRALYV